MGKFLVLPEDDIGPRCISLKVSWRGKQYGAWIEGGYDTYWNRAKLLLTMAKGLLRGR